MRTGLLYSFWYRRKDGPLTARVPDWDQLVWRAETCSFLWCSWKFQIRQVPESDWSLLKIFLSSTHKGHPGCSVQEPHSGVWKSQPVCSSHTSSPKFVRMRLSDPIRSFSPQPLRPDVSVWFKKPLRLRVKLLPLHKVPLTKDVNLALEHLKNLRSPLCWLLSGSWTSLVELILSRAALIQYLPELDLTVSTCYWLSLSFTFPIPVFTGASFPIDAPWTTPSSPSYS